jgi:hypothetical protein
MEIRSPVQIAGSYRSMPSPALINARYGHASQYVQPVMYIVINPPCGKKLKK